MDKTKKMVNNRVGQQGINNPSQRSEDDHSSAARTKHSGCTICAHSHIVVDDQSLQLLTMVGNHFSSEVKHIGMKHLLSRVPKAQRLLS